MKPETSKRYNRTVTLVLSERAGETRAEVDDANRIVRGVSVSSDEPYERFYGTEILLHDDGSINLDRVKSGAAPLLFNHDRDAMLGKVSNPQIRDGKLFVDFKFSQSEAGMQALADVKDKLLTECSIGYDVSKFEVDEDEETYTALQWTLYECSLVTIPADFTVGVGRNQHPSNFRNQNNMNTQNEEPKPNLRDANQERQRIQDIRALAKLPTFSRFVRPDDMEQAIDEGWSKSKFQNLLVDQMGNLPTESLITHDSDPGQRAGAGGASLGEQIVQRRDFEVFARSTSRDAKFHVELPHALGIRTLTTAGLTGIDKQPNVVGLGVQQLLVSDLLSQGTTTQPNIRFVQEKTLVLAATAVAEGQTKPSANLDLAELDSPVRKIAVLAKISTEMMLDFPQVTSFLNSRLGYMVGNQVDQQLLNGSGLGPNLLGILATTGIQTRVVGTDTPLDAIFNGITTINAVGFFQADAVVLHPNTWAKLRLQKDLNNQYFGSGPFGLTYGNQVIQMQVPTLWQLPVAVSISIAEGKALIGAFRQCGFIFWRNTLSLDMGYSNDDFERNLISIRAEERLALAVVSPLGFCEVNGL